MREAIILLSIVFIAASFMFSFHPPAQDPQQEKGGAKVPPVDVPAFVCVPKQLLSKVKAVPGSPLRFKTAGIGQPQDVSLVPFYRIFEQRHTVYWNVYSPAENTGRDRARLPLLRRGNR